MGFDIDKAGWTQFHHAGSSQGLYSLVFQQDDAYSKNHSTPDFKEKFSIPF